MKKIALLLIFASLIAASILGAACPSYGQGLLLVDRHDDHFHLPRPIPRAQPTPPMSYKIKEFSINARIQDQIARTQVTQSFVNTGSRQMEVSFVFPLPYDGAIDRLTFMVDGKEYDAKLLPAKEARSIYEGYIRRNQDPALLEWIGTGMFKTSVFPIPPGAERKVTLRYSQLLRKDHELTDYLFPLATAKYTSKPIEKVAFKLSIETAGKLKSVYSPTHDITIHRSGDHNATVEYEAKDSVPAHDFRLMFDTASESIGASLISYWPSGEKDGYFLLMASPEIKAATDERPKKTVIFVIDRSGSMSGKKIEQAKEALKFVVNNLRQGDTFNIVAYDSEIESFRPELQRFNDDSRAAAMGFIEGIYAGGSTNISSALKTSLDMIQEKSRPNYIVFLTDGRPTAGETNEMKIVEATTQLNRYGTRLVSFGVGYDVNSRLIDRLSRSNRGQSEYVRPDEDIEAHVSRLYAKISDPVLTDVAVKFDFDHERQEDGPTVNRIYPKEVFDLFEGEQLVLVGRYRKSGVAKVKIVGAIGDKKETYKFPVKFYSENENQSYNFVEKLWAMRRIGEIIDKLDLEGSNQELIDELVSLSTAHGIMTPYTSFLADDQADASQLADFGFNRGVTRERLRNLKLTEGADAFFQRAEKGILQRSSRVPTTTPHANESLDLSLPAAPSSNSSRFGAYGGARPSRGLGGMAAGATPGQSGGTSDHLSATAGDGVQLINNNAFYKRGKLLIAANASHVNLEKPTLPVVEMKRFSKEYFELVKQNSEPENALLSQQQADQELVIVLRGSLYRIK